MVEPGPYTVEQHFAGRSPEVRKIYRRLLAASRALGPVAEEAKKTSIHLVAKTAFAGVATRREVLILTLKSEADIESPRVGKREHASAHRWHLEIKLARADEVDAELSEWLARSYRLAG